MENVPSRPHPGRFFVLFAVSVTLTLVFASVAGAQADGSDIPAGTAAEGSNPDSPSSPPDLITIRVSDCTVDQDASITVEDGDGTEARFVDGQEDVVIRSTASEVRIEGPNDAFIGDHAVSTSDRGFDTDGDYTVVTSTGITCTDTADAARQNQADDQFDCASFGSQESAQATLDADPSDPNNLDPDGNGRACDGFDFGVEAEQQGGGNTGKQYGEVIRVTVVKGKLPGTGGPSPLLLPWLAALVAAGVVVLRRS